MLRYYRQIINCDIVKKFLKRSIVLLILFSFLIFVVSCEKDFTEINTDVISNTKFDVKDTIIDIIVTNAPVDNVRGDALGLNFAPFSGLQGQYLLGVNINDDYEDVEASIVSQIGINTSAKLATYENPDNLPFATQIDTVFIKIPYQATLLSNTDKPEYRLDSVIGNAPFTVNVYRLNTYLSVLNPDDPSKINTYMSDFDYDYDNASGNELNEILDMEFVPNTKDTLFKITRRSADGNLFDTDSIRFTTTSNIGVPIPMAVIPLKKSFAKEVFLDNFEGVNFASQDVFNDYFRGIVIEAKERATATNDRDGSLISFSMNNGSSELNPSIEIYYTNTYFKQNTNEIDTVVKQNRSFQLSGIINNSFKMANRTYPDDNQVVLQGLAGSEANVQLLSNIQLDDLRAKNWLINDASISFYINQSIDTTLAPFRLYMYKKGQNASNATVLSQIKDTYTEGNLFAGDLIRENNKKDRYTFRITDYISDLLNGETVYNPDLRLKVHNATDGPLSVIDTIFRSYNWSPKAIYILNHEQTNGDRRAQLKISYSQKKN